MKILYYFMSMGVVSILFIVLAFFSSCQTFNEDGSDVEAAIETYEQELIKGSYLVTGDKIHATLDSVCKNPVEVSYRFKHQDSLLLVGRWDDTDSVYTECFSRIFVGGDSLEGNKWILRGIQSNDDTVFCEETDLGIPYEKQGYFLLDSGEITISITGKECFIFLDDYINSKEQLIEADCGFVRFRQGDKVFSVTSTYQDLIATTVVQSTEGSCRYESDVSYTYNCKKPTEEFALQLRDFSKCLDNMGFIHK